MKIAIDLALIAFGIALVCYAYSSYVLAFN